MYAFIEGEVCEKLNGSLVLLASGVGWQLNCSNNTLQAAPALGEKMRCWTYLSVREDAMELFGFSTREEKEMFLQLTSVSGIGPKAALSILSANTPEGLALAVASGNEKALTVAPGIGKKIAQRVILELKDKIAKDSAFGTESFAAPTAPISDNSAVGDAVAALTVLGYNSNEIAQVLKTTDVGGMSTEQIIKTVLRRMVK